MLPTWEELMLYGKNIDKLYLMFLPFSLAFLLFICRYCTILHLQCMHILAFFIMN